MSETFTIHYDAIALETDDEIWFWVDDVKLCYLKSSIENIDRKNKTLTFNYEWAIFE